MERELTREGREVRGWYLVARGRAEELEKAIRRRRETVADLLARAIVPDQMAQTEAAARYRDEKLRDIVARFDKYPDVADLVAQARAGLPAESATAPEKSKAEGDAGRPAASQASGTVPKG